MPNPLQGINTWPWLSLCVLLLPASLIHASGMSATSEELAPKYVLAVAANETAQAETSVEASNGKLMRDAAGRTFSCEIPAPAVADGPSAEGEDGAQQQSPSQLLAALGSLCMYRTEDWWTYEICPGRHVRQFHQQGKTLLSQYQLGKLNANATRMDNVLQGTDDLGEELAYVKEVYADGEPCDLTLNARSAEVHYTCAEGREAITSIREPATCAYIFTIGTSRLCSHPAFHTKAVPSAAISCQLSSLGKAAGATLGFGGPVAVRGGGRQARIDQGTGAHVELSPLEESYEDLRMPLWQQPFAWLGRSLRLGIHVSAQEAGIEAEPVPEQTLIEDTAVPDSTEASGQPEPEAEQVPVEEAAEEVAQDGSGDAAAAASDELTAVLQPTIEEALEGLGQDSTDPAAHEQALAELTAKMEAALLASQASQAEGQGDAAPQVDDQAEPVVADAQQDAEPAHVEL